MVSLFGEIDKVDKKIISLLQEDASMSYTKIGKIVKKSQPAVGARVLKLDRSGILGNQKGVNFKTCGLPLIFLDVKSVDKERMMQRANVCPFVMNVFSQLGESNFKILMTASSIESLNHILNDCYRKDNTLKIEKTTFAFSAKNDFVLPVDFQLESYEGGNCPYNCPFNTKKIPVELDNTSPIIENILEREELKENFDKMLFSVKNIADCDNVGVRLIDSNGKIKFYSWKGINQEFYLSENEDCMADCLCGKLAKGDVISTRNKKVSEKSFISNDLEKDATKLLKSNILDKSAMKGYCFDSNFKSLALIRIEFEDEKYGVLFFSSVKKNKFPPETVSIIESFSDLISNFVKSYSEI